MSVRAFLLVGIPLTLAAAPLGYDLTASRTPKAETPLKVADPAKIAARLCASRSVNERLKARIFDDATAVANGSPANLELLASLSEVRMDQPVVKERDEELGVTVCSGRFVLLLPQGSEQKFGGRTLLQADVEYAAQPAADGSGLVYQLRGADSIVYRLAAYNLKADPGWPEKRVALAEAGPELATPMVMPAPQPAPVAAPAPEPSPPHVVVAAKPQPEKPKPVTREEKPPVKLASVSKKSTKKIEKSVKLAKAEPSKKATAKNKPVAVAKAGKGPEPKQAAKARRVEFAAKPAPKAAKPVKLAAASTKPAKPSHEVPVKLAARKPSPAPRAKPVMLASARPAPVRRQDLARVVKLALNEPARPAPKPASHPKPEAAAPRCSIGSVAERLVCASPNLAAKQRTANNFYYAAMEQANQRTRGELSGSRSRFQAYLQRCRSETCIANAFDDRIAEIKDISGDF